MLSGRRTIIVASFLLFLMAILVGFVLVVSRAQSKDTSLAECEASALADKPLFERLQLEFTGALSDAAEREAAGWRLTETELTYILRGDRLLLNAVKRDVGTEMERSCSTPEPKGGWPGGWCGSSANPNPKLKQLRMKWTITETAFDRVNEFILNCMARHGYEYNPWFVFKFPGLPGLSVPGNCTPKPSGDDVDWDPAFRQQCYVPATLETKIRNWVER